MLGDFNKLTVSAEPESDDHQLNLAFRFSKYGIPCIEYSPKPGIFREKNVVEDMLWAGEIPGVRGRPYKAVMNQWWSDFQFHANADSIRWRRVQEAMSRFACLVEVKSKPGVGWIEVKPDKASASEGPKLLSPATVCSSLEKKQWSASRRRSNLRNEIILD